MTTPKIFPAVTISSGIAGAVIGGTVTAVRDGIRVSEGSMTKKEAAKHIATESAGTGLSTAAGVAVTAVAGATGLLGLMTFAGVAAGVKHVWDKKVYATCTKKEEVTA